MENNKLRQASTYESWGKHAKQVARQCTITTLFSLEVEVSCLVLIFISLDKFLPPDFVLWTIATLVESRAT
jgi:hypothetical protein